MIGKKLIFVFVLLIGLFTVFSYAFAAENKTIFKPEVTIPKSEFKAGEGIEVTGLTLAKYIAAIYKWSIRAIAIIAVIIIMIAGFRWMTAAGNVSIISQTKEQMISALIGLILAIGANFFLYFLNPALVRLKSLSLKEIKRATLPGENVKVELCLSNGYQRYVVPSEYLTDCTKEEDFSKSEYYYKWFKAPGRPIAPYYIRIIYPEEDCEKLKRKDPGSIIFIIKAYYETTGCRDYNNNSCDRGSQLFVEDISLQMFSGPEDIEEGGNKFCIYKFSGGDDFPIGDALTPFCSLDSSGSPPECSGILRATITLEGAGGWTKQFPLKKFYFVSDFK